MSLKYYNATNSIRKPNPKASYYEDYAAILSANFDNAPNVAYNEVEYEVTYGQNDFKKIDRVRIDTVLEYNTGIIIGDDYKTFIFPPEFNVEVRYGMKFRWKNNYWLVVNTNSYESTVNSAEVRRCNNVLRFFGENGERIYEPCIMDYTLRFANNEDTMTITVGNGEQKVWCQRNNNTTLITPNTRFLFGSPNQRVSFRLYGGGSKNYLNTDTMDDNSPTLTEFYMEHYEVNPLFDDIENGFADAYLDEVKIVFDSTSDVSLNVGNSDVLEATVYKGNIIQKDVSLEWTSSKSNIVSISNNIATALSLGTSKITASIDGTDISNSFNINVISSALEDVYELVVTPDIDYVLQGKSQKFSVFLYKNGAKQSDAITFNDLSENIPVGRYQVVVNDSNSFTITNYEMYMKNPVVIKCICGDYQKELNIKLRGLY